METKPSSEDEAFTRLEELLAQLPAMEKNGERLATAREARALRDLQNISSALTKEWEQLNAECQDLRIEERSLREESKVDTKRYATVIAKIRYLSELIAVRQAPYTRARKALEDALETGTLTLDSPLDTLALSDETFDGLEKLVTHYQQEYVAVLARCEELAAE